MYEMSFSKRKLVYAMWKIHRRVVQSYHTDWRIHDYEAIKTADPLEEAIWVVRHTGTRFHPMVFSRSSETLYDALNTPDAEFYKVRFLTFSSQLVRVAPLWAMMCCGIVTRDWIDGKFRKIDHAYWLETHPTKVRAA